MKAILELSEVKAYRYFMDSSNYCSLDLPKYIDFSIRQWLYIPSKCALFLSFADVMCFFISVYILIRVSEKYQNILFLLPKRREK